MKKITRPISVNQMGMISKCIRQLPSEADAANILFGLFALRLITDKWMSLVDEMTLAGMELQQAIDTTNKQFAHLREDTNLYEIPQSEFKDRPVSRVMIVINKLLEENESELGVIFDQDLLRSFWASAETRHSHQFFKIIEALFNKGVYFSWVGLAQHNAMDAIDEFCDHFALFDARGLRSQFTSELSELIAALLPLKPHPSCYFPNVSSLALIEGSNNLKAYKDSQAEYSLDIGVTFDSTNKDALRKNALKCLFIGARNPTVTNTDWVVNPHVCSNGKMKSYDFIFTSACTPIPKPNKDFLKDDEFNRFVVDGNYYYQQDEVILLHALKSLNSAGKAALLMPNALQLNAGSSDRLRRYLINNNLLDAVINLPKRIVKTVHAASLFLLDNSKEDNHVLFIDASLDSVPDGKRTKLRRDSIPAIVQFYTDRTNHPGVSGLASNLEIKNNSYSLAITRYIDQVDEFDEVDLEAVRHEMLQLHRQQVLTKRQIIILEEQLLK